MSPRTLFAIGGVWLTGAALWLCLSPKQFFHSWHAVGTERAWIAIGIYLFAVLYQVFIFGWLIPIGMGLYKTVKR
jgi:hypothetical protein